MLEDNDENILHVSNNTEEGNVSVMSAEFMTTVDENYRRFQDLMNQSFSIECNLEKELAKEDKKCTFLRRKIENLRNEMMQSEKVNVELREYIHNQQMEIEQISSSINEQKKQLKMTFPDEGVSYYSNTVTVIRNMIDYVKNVKVRLINISRECSERNVEVKIRAEALEKTWNRICQLLKEVTKLRNTAARLKQLYMGYDFDSMQRNVILLTERFNECMEVKHSSAAASAEISRLQKQLQECIGRTAQAKDNVSETSEKINSIIGVYSKEYNAIKKMGIEIENEYYAFTKEWDLRISDIHQQVKLLEDQIYLKKEKFDDLISQEIVLKREIDEISARIVCTEAEYQKLVAQKYAIEEQENCSLKMKSAMEQQLNILESNEKQIALDQLTQEITLLQMEINVNAEEMQKTSLSTDELRQLIANEENNLNALESINERLEDDVCSIKEITKELLENHDKMKSELIMRHVERASLETTIQIVKEKLNYGRIKRITEINRKVKESRENTVELSNSIYEKKLFIDSLHKDIRDITDQYISMQLEVWSADQENKKMSDELKHLQEEISKETLNCENKEKLLRDLKRNSFSRSQIPVNWFKSFEKQKREYEQLVNEKSELEKRRNNLIIALDSDGFQRSRSGTPSKNEDNAGSQFSQSGTHSTKEESRKAVSGEEAKNALFRVFQEKVKDRKLLTG